MYRLTDEQIEFILSDIEKRGIETETLKYDLLDHICCIIEQDPDGGKDFETIYQKAVCSFYRKDLREIEEETILLLTFNNYYTMKKMMILSGIFSAGTMLLGIWFKIMHYPGAGVILPIGIFFASLIFLPLLVILKSKEQQNLRDKLVTLTGSVGAILLLCGIGLKIFLSTPGSSVYPVMFYSSMAVIFIIFLPVYFLTGIRNPATKLNTIVTSLMLIIVYAIIFTMTYKAL